MLDSLCFESFSMKQTNLLVFEGHVRQWLLGSRDPFPLVVNEPPVVNCVLLVINGIQSRMTTDWIEQSSGLYRAKRERELHHHYRWMV